MNRALLLSGAAAVAAMTGCSSDNTSTTPTGSTATPSAGGPGAPGGGGTMVSYTDFKGVTTDGTVVPDLFAVHSTGVSTAAVVAAGTAFVAALTDAQKAETLYDVTADQWLNWSNIHNFSRNGVRMKDMTAAQQKAALAVLQAGLSAEGLALSNNIRKLNHVTGRLMGRLDQFDEDLYFITVMGTPSQTEPWGWQFQGHHLVLNYFVLGDQVVMTPTFLGSEPRVGYYDDGTKIELFTEELAAGVAMINALDASQKAEAITAATKGGTVNSTEAGKDNAVLPYAGIKVSELTTAQQTRLLDLANLFVGNMDTGHAAVKMAEIKDKLAETYFAWQGPTTADGAFYFRIQSPVILIEFDCQGGGPASGAVEAALVPDNATKTGVVSGNTQGGGPAPGGSGGPQPGSGPPGADASGGAAPGGGGGGGSRNHIHAVIRTPNGNDYGFDLLKEHLATHPHPSAT